MLLLMHDLHSADLMSLLIGNSRQPFQMRTYNCHGSVQPRRVSQGARCSRSRACTVPRAASVAAPAAQMCEGLTPQQVAQFHEDGYLVLPGFASLDTTKGLIARANQLVSDFDPSVVSIFSTKDNNQAHAKDAYFLDSDQQISFFFEEKAFTDGKLTTPKATAINKIGHALHVLDPAFHAFSSSPAMAAILRSLGYRRPVPVQSMYIFKQPHIGGEVVPHQDSTFLHTQPLSCLGLWVALEDANLSNGCLWAAKGSHKAGLARRFLLGPNNTGLTFDQPAPQYDLSEFEPLEVPAGTLVLLQGEVVHYSAENTSPVSRHSYSMHVVESAPGVTWSAGNWAHREGRLPFQPFYDETADQQPQQQQPAAAAQEAAPAPCEQR